MKLLRVAGNRARFHPLVLDKLSVRLPLSSLDSEAPAFNGRYWSGQSSITRL